jgi:hypothetical protein
VQRLVQKCAIVQPDDPYLKAKAPCKPIDDEANVVRRSRRVPWEGRPETRAVETGTAAGAARTAPRGKTGMGRWSPELPADGADLYGHSRGLESKTCVGSLAAAVRPLRGHQPALRASNPIAAIPTATAPKIACNMLKPRNGIWTSNSIADNALASRTAGTAQTEPRQASQAARPEGTATVRNNHPAKSVQLESPNGLSTDTGGVAAPARS